MRVVVLYERSGIVREAFRARGHDAISVDLLPAEDGSEYHEQRDISDALLDLVMGADLVIAHPVCTDLSVSGAHRFAEKRADGRQDRAKKDFLAVANCGAPRLCVENPVSIMSTVWRKPDQIIQPNEFGHDASKKTCLWLKGLPKLVKRAADFVPPRWVCPKCSATFRETLRPLDRKTLCFSCLSATLLPRWANQTDSGQNRLGPSEERAMNRARTYQGIARAMAEQWTTTTTTTGDTK